MASDIEVAPNGPANGARRIEMEIAEIIEALKELDSLRKEVETLRSEVETLRKENEELKGKQEQGQKEQEEEQKKKEEEEQLKKVLEEIDEFLENLKECRASDWFVSTLKENAKPDPKKFLKTMKAAQDILFDDGVIDVWNKVIGYCGVTKVMDVFETIASGNVTVHSSLTDMWLDNHSRRTVLADEEYDSYVDWDAIAEDAYSDGDYIETGDGCYILLEDVL